MYRVPFLRVLDDRRRELIFARTPERIVSLVPSDTLNVRALGRRLIGQTRYCDPGDGAAIVGGTKDVDVEAVAALQPDLILANQEENSQVHLERLAALHLPVLIAFPRTVADGIAHFARLSRVLNADAKDLLRRALVAEQVSPLPPVPAFVPIWMDPLMTVNGQTYMSDALRVAGALNVFHDRQRRFPLAADLGQAIPTSAGTRDTRYPRITFEEVVARKPSIVLLPDEPHPFNPADKARFQALLPEAKVILCGGRDLSWYGFQAIDGMARLRALIDSLR
jgi:ABC-type Fe3+-hydroxamate transport system substrate-binding protein